VKLLKLLSSFTLKYNAKIKIVNRMSTVACFLYTVFSVEINYLAPALGFTDINQK